MPLLTVITWEFLFNMLDSIKYIFSVTISLVYNTADLREKQSSSACVFRLSDRIQWSREYSFTDGDKDNLATMDFSLENSDEKEQSSCRQENNFILHIENIIAENEMEAGQLIEKDLHDVCRTLSFQASIHNPNKQEYQPRVQPNYYDVIWSKDDYKAAKQQSEAEQVHEYIDENGKRVISLQIENTIFVQNHASMFLTISTKLMTEEFLRYYHMKKSTKLEFALEEYFIALGTENMKSKFFHLFTIIELIEDKYVKLSDATKIFNKDKVEDILEGIEKKIKPDEREMVSRRMKELLLKITDKSRASKLTDILSAMNIKTIQVCGEQVAINDTLTNSWIKLRNKSYHAGGVERDKKKHIPIDLAVTQLMEVCQKVVQFMMENELY